jgi:hypothetical protein
MLTVTPPGDKSEAANEAEIEGRHAGSAGGGYRDRVQQYEALQ